MNNRLYIANLPTTTTDDTLRSAFSGFGAISNVFVATDRDTGQPRGYAFVTYATADEAQSAIAGMSGAAFEGRTLTVSEARPPEVITPPRAAVRRPPPPGRGGPGGFAGRGQPRR